MTDQVSSPTQSPNYIALAADIVSAFVSNNSVPSSDLPALIGDMSEAAGWARWERRDFSVARTMAAINPAARKYRQGFGAVESAVVLER